MVTDFFPRLADVGSSTKHAFVGHDAHGEEIDRSGVVLTTHDLGSHVSRRSRRVLCVVLTPNPRNAEVCNPHIPVNINHKVLRLNVPVDDVLFVEIFEARDEACYKEPRRLFIESAISADMVAEITSRQVIHNQIEVLAILERIVHVDEEGVL